jgi:hypothetical protein
LSAASASAAMCSQMWNWPSLLAILAKNKVPLCLHRCVIQDKSPASLAHEVSHFVAKPAPLLIVSVFGRVFSLKCWSKLSRVANSWQSPSGHFTSLDPHFFSCFSSSFLDEVHLPIFINICRASNSSRPSKRVQIRVRFQLRFAHQREEDPIFLRHILQPIFKYLWQQIVHGFAHKFVRIDSHLSS